MNTSNRHYSIADQFCMRIDRALHALHSKTNSIIERANPADQQSEYSLTEPERKHSAGLMRVNHVGEVCAQALYQGQALTAKLPDTREAMQQAAQEEQDHLRWCAERLQELQSHTSYLNPFWYLGAFAMGSIAGICGDKWSLGFVVETERQVVAHLESHQEKLSIHDKKSRAIVDQMALDEAEHAKMAQAAGAAELPAPIKAAMRVAAKIMTTTAYWI